MTDTAADTGVNFLVILILVVVLACPICSAIVAGSKGRAIGGWFVAGFIFGPFGLLAIVGMPPLESSAVRRARQGKYSTMKICPYCIEPMREEASVCSHCCQIWVEQPSGA